jgi:hypothetical protein
MYMLRSVFIDCVYALAQLGLGLGGFAHEVTRLDVADMFEP